MATYLRVLSERYPLNSNIDSFQKYLRPCLSFSIGRVNAVNLFSLLPSVKSAFYSHGKSEERNDAVNVRRSHDRK